MIPGALRKISGDLVMLRNLLRETPPMEVLEMIQNVWSRYLPSPSGVCISGVDSGYNYLEMRGYIVYLVDGVYVGSCGGSDGDARVGIISSESDPEAFLSYLSIAIELELARKAAGSSRVIAIDGSMISKLGFLVRRAPYALEDGGVEAANGLIRSLVSLSISSSHRVAFISKNSISRDLVHAYFPKSYRAFRADIYYLSRYTIEPGYSRPLVLGLHDGPPGILGILEYARRVSGESSFYIALTYVRLKPGGPVMRVEIPLRDPEGVEDYVRYIVDSIAGDDAGYPLVLRVADRMARVSSRDMEKIKRILGLGYEEEAWEAAKAI